MDHKKLKDAATEKPQTLLLLTHWSAQLGRYGWATNTRIPIRFPAATTLVQRAPKLIAIAPWWMRQKPANT